MTTKVKISNESPPGYWKGVQIKVIQNGEEYKQLTVVVPPQKSADFYVYDNQQILLSEVDCYPEELDK